MIGLEYKVENGKIWWRDYFFTSWSALDDDMSIGEFLTIYHNEMEEGMLKW